MKSDIDGLIKNFTDVINKTDESAKRFMRKEAQKERRRMLAAAKRKVRKLTGNYLKGFKAGKKVYQWIDADYTVRVYNDAPHAHLIENGHRLILGEKFVRWIPGRHVMEDTHRKFEDEYAADVEDDLADFICKELEK